MQVTNSFTTHYILQSNFIFTDIIANSSDRALLEAELVANAEVQMNDNVEDSFLIRLNQLREVAKDQRKTFLSTVGAGWEKNHPIFKDFIVDSHFRDAVLNVYDFNAFTDGPGILKCMNKWHGKGADSGIIGGVGNF